MRQFALFCVSGVLATGIDAGIVQALVSLAGMDPYLARGISFLCAVTSTWLFNRHFTFAPPPGVPLHREWAKYVATQLGGFSVNFLVYAALVWAFAPVRQWPALGVAAGSLAGLSVNYLAARHLVFAGPRGGR